MESHQTSFRRAQNASYVGKGSLSMSADAFDVAQNEYSGPMVRVVIGRTYADALQRVMETARRNATIRKKEDRLGVSEVDCLLGAENIPEAQDILIHLEVLCKYSTWFRHAVQGDPADADLREFELPDVMPKHFARIISCLYTGRLLDEKFYLTQPGDDPLALAGDELEKCPTILQLIRIWIFGQDHDIPILQNEVISTMHHLLHGKRTISVTAANLAYRKTLPGAELRRFIVECHVGVGFPAVHVMPDRAIVSCKELTRDCCDKHNGTPLLERRRMTQIEWASLDLCRFHVHHGLDCKGQNVDREEQRKARMPKVDLNEAETSKLLENQHAVIDEFQSEMDLTEDGSGDKSEGSTEDRIDKMVEEDVQDMVDGVVKRIRRDLGGEMSEESVQSMDE